VIFLLAGKVCSGVSFEIAAKGGGREAFVFFEGIGKIIGVGVTAGFGNLCDRKIFFEEQLLGVFEAAQGNIFGGGHMEFLLEFPDETVGAEK
jgi:hypothetical protein